MSSSYSIAARPTSSNNFYAIAAGILANGLSRRLDPFLSETRHPNNAGGKTVPPAGSGIRYCLSGKTGGTYKGAPVQVAEIAGERFDQLTDELFTQFIVATYGANEAVLSRLQAGIARFLASDAAAALSEEARTAITAIRTAAPAKALPQGKRPTPKAIAAK
jgi:hypothetical protein